MGACPNKNSKEWIDLVNKIGIKEAYREYINNKYEIPDASLYQETFKGVNATTKIVGALMTTVEGKDGRITHPAVDAFNKFYLKGNIDKFFNELAQKFGATKQQIEQAKEWVSINNPKSIEDFITGLLAETTYGVQIKTATETKENPYENYAQEFSVAGDTYSIQYEDNDDWNPPMYTKNGQEISYEEYTEASARSNSREIPTSYYSSLTVPGGTNYRENEIATPAIVSSIKGHAQFATDNGIGWFRSDEQASNNDIKTINKIENQYGEDLRNDFDPAEPKTNIKGEGSKTRRILEVQSDLFQKARKNFILGTSQYAIRNINGEDKYELMKGSSPSTYISKEKYFEAFDAYVDGGGLSSTSKVNGESSSDTIQKDLDGTYSVHNRDIGLIQSDFKTIREAKEFLGINQSKGDFLAFLLKENNWVSFFVQSIIQDSAFKGYEKVLFPTGNTAAKVEGHQTLEEYIEGREKMITEAKERLEKITNKEVDLSSLGDDYIDGKTINSTYTYVRVRKNYWAEKADGSTGYTGGSKPYLGREDYKGYVIDEYNSGGGNEHKVTEITQERAKELLQNVINNNKKSLINEINQFEKELDDAKNGRAKFSSIATFYEDHVYNVLKKKGYNPIKIKDEHGNTWNEVTINEDRDSNTIFFNRESNPALFEQRALDYLSKKGLLSQEKRKTEKGKFPLVSSDNLSTVENVSEIEKVNTEFEELYGYRPYVVVRLGNDSEFVVEVNKEASTFAEEKSLSEEGANSILTTLSNKLGIDYEFISPTQAREITKEAKIAWNGENAFFYNNKVYFIKGQVGVNDALHEFAHPFVAAIRKANPSLYSKLIADIMQSDDPLLASIVDEVNNMYHDMSQSIQLDELIVRALAAMGNKLAVQPQTRNIFQKILFAIKQLIRKIFGENLNLDSLSTNTTMSELAEMLYVKPEKINIQKEENLEDVFFNKEMKTELANKLNNDQVVKHIGNFFMVIKDHVRKLKDSKNYGALAKLLSTEDSSIHGNVERLLSLAETFENDASKQEAKLMNFAQAIIGVEQISQKMKEHVLDLVKSGTPEKDLLRTFRYYAFLMNDWKNVFSMLEEDTAGNLGLVDEKIKNTLQNFRVVENEIDKVNEKGLAQFFEEVLTPAKENIQRDLDYEIAKLEKLVSTGDKSISKRLNEYKGFKKRFDFSREGVLKYLRGEMGDTNPFSALLESYTSSPDPIIGGFAVALRTQFNRVMEEMQAFTTKLGNELDSPKDSLYKQAGIDISDPEAMGKLLTHVESVFSKDKDGKATPFQVRVLLNAFAGNWLYDFKEQQDILGTAIESGDLDEIRKARVNFEDFKEKYFHREYTDEVYEIKKFWNKNDITRLAQSKRKEIIDELKSYNSYVEVDQESLEDIDRLQKELKALSSTTNIDGTSKSPEDIDVAKAIQEYNALSKKLYEDVEIKNAFFTSLNDFKNNLEFEGYKEGTPEYNKRLNAWVKQNIVIRATEKFYEEKKVLGTEIDEIMSNIPEQYRKKMMLGEKWQEIFEQIRGFRDANGQPVGTDLSEAKIKVIKELQEKIDNIRETFRKMNGLSAEDDSRMSHYMSLINSNITLTPEQNADYEKLVEKQSAPGLNKAQRTRLSFLFSQMNALQSKIPTDYYLERMNIEGKNAGFQILPENMDVPLTVMGMDSILEKDAAFKEWFLKNHLTKMKFNEDTEQTEEVYERLYIWNRVVPNDEVLLNALKNGDYQTLINYQSQYVETKKANKYYFHRVKDEYRNERVVGKNVDNRGNWLPKTVAQGAHDSKYENKEYFRLKNSTSSKDKALFKILETFTRYHLSAQEDAPVYARLWMEVPRLRKHTLEEANAVMRQPGESVGRIWDYAKLQFSRKSKSDDFDRGDMSPADIKKQTKLYVSTDLFGNEINSIPMKHMSRIDVDKVSLDLGRSIVKYAVSVKNNKMLHDINPIAQALQSVLEKNGVKDVDKMSRLSRAKNLIMPKSKDNTRLGVINNMIERDIEGIESKMELGVFGNRVAKHIMAVAATGSLAMNIPAGIKNAISARIQNILEGVSGQSYTLKDLADANSTFFRKFLPQMVKDYNKFAGRGLETQLFELFDPVEGKYEEHIGESFSASYKKDAVNLRFLTSPQKFGEIQAQGISMLAMMRNTMVDITENGKTRKISYDKAWTLIDGVVDVLPGVDPEYGRKGKKFQEFKIKLHKVNELLQGAYAKSNQPEIDRYTMGKMAFFMRRYLVPGVVNRFSVRRPNIALANMREGYYNTFIRLFGDMFKNKLKNWDTYSESEKKNIQRVLVEAGYSVIFLILLGLMGYNDDDKDKYKKLRNNSYAHNMLIYELLMIKGEVETFIPLPNLGMNELLRMKDTPSIAFPLLNKYNKLIVHFLDLIRNPFTSNDLIHYRTKTGIYEKGDLKLKADLLRVIGFTGTTFKPEVGIRNYSSAMSRYQ